MAGRVAADAGAVTRTWTERSDTALIIKRE